MSTATEFASESYTAEELNAIVKKLIEAVGKDGPKKLLKGELEISVKKALGGLSPGAPITVGPLSGVFYPEFFSKGNPEVKLCIWDGFKKRILAAAKKVSKKPAVSLVSRDLTRPMDNSEILAELPPDHLFALDDLWMVAKLIVLQSNGEDGVLRINSYANLFYFQIGPSVVVVYVLRRGGGWSLGGWDLGEGVQWHGGDRVFSRNG